MLINFKEPYPSDPYPIKCLYTSRSHTRVSPTVYNAYTLQRAIYEHHLSYTTLFFTRSNLFHAFPPMYNVYLPHRTFPSAIYPIQPLFTLVTPSRAFTVMYDIYESYTSAPIIFNTFSRDRSFSERPLWCIIHINLTELSEAPSSLYITSFT